MILLAVALTIVCEGVTWWIVLRPQWLATAGTSRSAILPGVIAVNLLTVPLANLGFSALLDQAINEWIAFGIVESAVVAAESPLILFVLGLTPGRAIILSLAANIVSLTVGLLIFW